MPEKTNCPTCGRTLETSGADCPGCLLNLARETSAGDDERTGAPERSPDAGRHALDAGSRVGPYTIVSKLGEGGMGVVYLAEQTEPIKRRVALKVIKHGMDTDQVVKRFEAERQALALMDHVAIARVFEAGETDSGRPYFAMEYVDGEPITTYSDGKRLDTAQRLDLFSKVCDGLQHAHQRGIIHRDIKPSNVLVTEMDGEAQPKIIDFGVAKATEQSLTDRSALTAMGVLLGTPEYMSPEQAELAPLDVDTRTDVYSLGVVLYEMLTGALPVDPAAIRKAAFDEVRRQIREVRPSKPSTRVSELGEKSSGPASSRRTDVSSLRRRLAGDLDLITMKALEKDRDQRYGSPSELAADIRRHLGGEPVLARPPSATYQLRKLISRHKLTSALIFGFVVVLIGFSIWMSLLYRESQANLDRALRAEEEAAQVSEFLVGVFEVSDPGEARGNDVTARELLDQAAERIDVELAEQPEVRASLTHTMGAVYSRLGLFDRSVELLRDGLSKRESLYGPDHPSVAKSLVELAGALVAQGDYDEAEALAKRAIAIQEAAEPGDALELAAALEALHLVYLPLRNHEDGLPLAYRILELREASAGKESLEYAAALTNLGNLHMSAGLQQEAEPFYQEALDLHRSIVGENHPATATAVLNLGELYRRNGRFEEAETMFLRVQEIESVVYAENHPGRATAFNNLGMVYVRMDRFDEAIAQYQEAIAIREASLPPDHPLIAWTTDNMGLAYRYKGDLGQAEIASEKALAIAMRSVGPDHPGTGIVKVNLALLRADQGRFDEAEALFRETLAQYRAKYGAQHWETGNTLHNLARVLTDVGRYEEAETLFAEAVEILEATIGADHPDTKDTQKHLDRVRAQLGKE